MSNRAYFLRKVRYVADCQSGKGVGDRLFPDELGTCILTVNFQLLLDL